MLPARPIIFNLKRLLARRHATTPTGVDRVDLHHARFVMDLSRHRRVIFVDQHSDVLFTVPEHMAGELIGALCTAWLEGAPGTTPPRSGRLGGIPRWISTHVRRMRGRPVDPGITSLLHGLPAPIYMNSAQGGVDHLALHQQIRRQLHAALLYYLHDLIPIDFPEYCSAPSGPVLHRRRLETMARTASVVLTNSRCTRERFLAYCRTNGWPCPDTRVLEIGVEDHIAVQAGTPLPPLPESYRSYLDGQAYFIVVGTIEPRKNHLLLLHIWRELAREMGAACPKLVIMGKRGWKYADIVSLYEQNPLLRERVIELNGVKDNEMSALLRHARALLFPSFEEGWGMPLAEALTLGVPALCSDIPALRECGQGCPSHLSPLDGLGWKNAIRQLITLPSPAGRTGYQPVTWQGHVNRLRGVIEAMDGETAASSPANG